MAVAKPHLVHVKMATAFKRETHKCTIYLVHGIKPGKSSKVIRSSVIE